MNGLEEAVALGGFTALTVYLIWKMGTAKYEPKPPSEIELEKQQENSLPITDIPKVITPEIREHLHHISGTLKGPFRELYVSDKNYSYVWCFKEQNQFQNSALVRMEGDERSAFTKIRDHKYVDEIVEKLREVHKKHRARFNLRQVVFDNEHKEYGATDLILGPPESRERISVQLAKGNDMARDLEKITRHYKLCLNKGVCF